MRSSSVQWLLVVTVGLIIAFVASTLFIEQKIDRVEPHVSNIVSNATPSVAELALARTEWGRLERSVAHYLSARSDGKPFDRMQIETARQGVESHLASYARNPLFPLEQPAYSEMLDAKTRAYRALDATIAAIDRGQLQTARALIKGEFDRAFDRGNVILGDLVGIKAAQANINGRKIDLIRTRSSFAALVLDGVTVVLGAVLSILAVRAMRLYERILREREQAAQARAVELDRFAVRVAHDLKGPLTSVLLGVTSAQQHPAQGVELLARVRRAAELMHSMIDALLDFARAGAEPQRGAVTPVQPVVDEVVAEVKLLADEAMAELLVERVPPGCAVACSAGALASVLSNLLGNAIKYIGGAERERRIRLRVAEVPGMVRLEVEDTGPGVSPEMESSIFEMYVRAKNAAAQPGLGLGLATVKRLVEAHNGRIGVRSTPRRGARFWVEFPRAMVPELVRRSGAPSPLPA
jgi:signal transduction histidine kinase